jgi:hypothetical protein
MLFVFNVCSRLIKLLLLLLNLTIYLYLYRRLDCGVYFALSSIAASVLTVNEPLFLHYHKTELNV